jgi:carboxylesterase type B
MIAGHLLDMLGVARGDLDALARVPADLVLEAQQKLTDELGQTRNPDRFGEAAAPAMAFQPTFGTPDLPERPLDALANGTAARVPMLIGSTKEEALIFLVDMKDLFGEELVHATMDGVFGAGWRSRRTATRTTPAFRPGPATTSIGAPSCCSTRPGGGRAPRRGGGCAVGRRHLRVVGPDVSGLSTRPGGSTGS